MVFKMGGEVPEMVRTVILKIEETEVFQDYRVIGNKYGTTIVLRYSGHDMIYGDTRRSPMWKHRSMVNVTRDNYRYNKWCKENTNPTSEWSNTDSSGVDPGCIEQSTPIHHTQGGGFVSFYNAGLNVNADEFIMPKIQPAILTTCSSTQTENQVQLTSIETQTELREKIQRENIGIQCKPTTQSVGITCNRAVATKNRHIQATPSIVSKGVTAISQSAESDTQTECAGINIDKQDAAVMCFQSPGAISRHVQTHRKVLKDMKTSTMSTKMADAATEMVDFKIDWGDCDEDNDIPPVEQEDPRLIPVQTFKGYSGLTDILHRLGAHISDIENYSHLIMKRNRNFRVKGVVEGIYKDKHLDKVKERKIYYAVMDDFVVDMYIGDENEFEVGRYTKLYGDWQQILNTTVASKVIYTILKPNDEVASKCEKALMLELDKILSNIRPRHFGAWGGRGSYGGYGGQFGYGYY